MGSYVAADQTRILKIASDLFGRSEITNAEAFAIVLAVETADENKIREKGGTFSLDGLRDLLTFCCFCGSGDENHKHRNLGGVPDKHPQGQLEHDPLAEAAEKREESLEHARDQRQDR